MNRLAAWLRRRWDVGATGTAALPFRAVRAELNLRRVELACILALIDDAMEAALGFAVPAVLAEFPVAIGCMLLSRRLLRASGPMLSGPMLPGPMLRGPMLRGLGRPSVRLQEGAVLAFFVYGLLSAQLSIGQIGASGRLSSGYPLMLFAMTLLFVLPPRALAAILLGTMASYALVIASLPVSAWEKWVAVGNAGMTGLVSQVTAALIHTARRTDHEQKQIIRAQNEHLQEQNRELDAVMAVTAHDLKSPLHGLRNLFDLAARRAEGDPALPLRVLREAVPSLDGMLGLVTRLLDAHLAQHGTLAMERTDVRVLLTAAARRIGPLAQATEVAMVLDLPDRPLLARLDEGAFGQVVDNLLGNAVRFSPAGAPLRLSCADAGPRVVVTVEDRGPGVDAAARAALFTRFHRGPTPGGTAGEGTGMGLFIAATLARRLGGELSHHPAVPHGAVFELCLPGA